MNADGLSNNPPEPIVIFAEQQAKYERDAAAFGAVTDANVAQVADHVTYGGKLSGEIEKHRVAEKEPHLEAGRAVDVAYTPVRDAVNAARSTLKTKLDVHLRAKRAEAERLAREKADELRRAEEAARAKVEQPVEEDPFLAATAEPAPDLATLAVASRVAASQAMASTRIASASGGAAYGLRRAPWGALITDLALLTAHYAAARHPDLFACVQKLASADVRNAKGSIVLPGAKVVGGE